MIRKSIAIVLTLAAVGTLAGAIASQAVPMRWSSRQHPRFPAPILSLGYEQMGRPQIIYYCDAPVGGPNLAERFWFVAGIWINTGKYHCGIRFYDVHCPLWMPVVLFVSYPLAYALLRHPLRRYRRRKQGLCARCGCNLTGNTSGRCPECGEAI